MTLYADLGVEEGANKESIRKAYKSKAGKYHPDKGGDVERFKCIQKAYAILSDDARRERYDATGETREAFPAEIRAADIICKLFIQAMEQSGFVKRDYTGDVRDQIRKVVQSDRETLKSMEAAHEAILYMIKHMTGNERVLAGINSRADGISKQIGGCKENISVNETALDLLSEFKYDGEDVYHYQRTTTVRMQSFSTTTAG